jgi:hypothetical protein
MTLIELRKILNDYDIEYMIKRDNTYSDKQRGNLVTIRFWCEEEKNEIK